MYEMKPEYFTGIDFIDKEHARLFAIADEAYQLLKNEFIPDKYDHIMNLVNELKDYTQLLSQKVAHEDFIQKINEYTPDVIDENQKETLLELLDFLATWLVQSDFTKKERQK